MKRKRFSGLVLLTLLAPGCLSRPAREAPLKPTLVRELEARGISHENTDLVLIRDTEGGYGMRAHVIAGEQFVIQEIWDSIYDSRPYSRWCACGFRKVEFYRDDDPRHLVVTLLVNETGEAHLEGKGPEDGFRCPGLFEVLSRLLDAKYRRPASEATASVSLAPEPEPAGE